MPNVAYLSNIFPSRVEPYVLDEIRELRSHGINVIPCSSIRSSTGPDSDLNSWAGETLFLDPLQFGFVFRAVRLFIRNFGYLKDFVRRALSRKRATERRFPALLHTFLGIYYAAMLEKRRVEHIHVHHGYFGSWVAMVAASVLNIPFSMTLHGSDLLIHAAYLDIKLRQCRFCVTISEFNRRHILANYPEIDRAKIFVIRMGVDCDMPFAPAPKYEDSIFRMLAVGRLHAVKDHAFLLHACHLLKRCGLHFVCSIVGEGPERSSLETLIRDLRLKRQVQLLGELFRDDVNQQYEKADLIVLTSRSEGIPLVLMEAMARGKTVLAPAITGIPELVEDGTTGFLYRNGSLKDFASRVELISNARSGLVRLRQAARQHVTQHFNNRKNTAAFCELLISHLRARAVLASNAEIRSSHENSVLQ